MRERKDKVAHGAISGSSGLREGMLSGFIGEAYGRYCEMDDFLEMKYEDLFKGE